MTSQTEIANKIAAALDGYHTEAGGNYGHALLSSKVWSKNGKVRVYLDWRYVRSDGTIDPRLGGFGYVEVLRGGEIVYATRNDTAEIRRVVEAL